MTGASGGIRAGIAVRLAEARAAVAVRYRSDRAAAEAVVGRVSEFKTVVGRSFRNSNPPTVLGRPISLGGSEVHRMVDIVPGQPDRRIELVG